MNNREAEIVVGLLIGGTGGWNTASDETLVIYVQHVTDLDDPHIARRAVETIIRTWTEPRRPPIATVIAAYSAERRRQIMDTPALPSQTPGRIVSVKEGRAIAARAYAAECRRRNPERDVHILSGFRTTEPNERILEAWLG